MAQVGREGKVQTGGKIKKNPGKKAGPPEHLVFFPAVPPGRYGLARFCISAFAPQRHSLLKGCPAGKKNNKIGMFLIVTGVEAAVFVKNAQGFVRKLAELAKGRV